ncbi:hypothetical protein DH2020_023504 [Rehmannia glutinosa]|uniref:Uncharacterized protein n=1 Tax=Rehmannia glutinosa TaxID=99300 RepID=A0ABR0W8U6_REHGL
MRGMSKLSVETEDSFSSLLEFAANNDVEGFRRSIELDLSVIDEAGLWYVRKKDSKQITQEERTPLMVAATYGSVDVLKLIVALPEVDLNRVCSHDKWTALHCAAFGGSVNAFDVVKLLLSAGADPNIEDACGLRPIDVIVGPPKVPGARAALEDMLMNNSSDGSFGDYNLRVSISTSNASSPILSSCPETMSPRSPSDSVSSPAATKFNDIPANSVSEKKQYPVDPSLPDIRNSIYATDESGLVQGPTLMIGPNAPSFTLEKMPEEETHESTTTAVSLVLIFGRALVGEGTCVSTRTVCSSAGCTLLSIERGCAKMARAVLDKCVFSQDTQEELRPLYVSTGSGVPSPRSAASAPSFMDMAAALSLLPGSPTSHSVMSPAFNHQTLSPTGNGMPHPSPAWPQPNVPTLHLPGSNLQSSRLRSSLSARDIPPEDLNMLLHDFDAQQLVSGDLACYSQPRPNSSMMSCSGRSQSALTPSNLEELFSAEITSSPRFSDQAVASGFFSPTRKSAVLSQFQQQQGSILSPINTNAFSPRNVEHPLLQASLGASSPRMSPRSLETASPLSTRLSAFAQREKQQQQMHSLGSSPTVGSPITGWAKWGPTNGKAADWSVGGDDQACLKRPSSIELKNDGDGPDLSWVQSLVKESPPEMMDKNAASTSGAAPSGECLKSNSQIDSIDHSVLGTWLEQMQLDQLVV